MLATGLRALEPLRQAAAPRVTTRNQWPRQTHAREWFAVTKGGRDYHDQGAPSLHGGIWGLEATCGPSSTLPSSSLQARMLTAMTALSRVGLVLVCLLPPVAAEAERV